MKSIKIDHEVTTVNGIKKTESFKVMEGEVGIDGEFEQDDCLRLTREQAVELKEALQSLGL